MAPKYTLHYFDLPARGQLIRIIFNHVGVEFTDTRYSFGDLPNIKADGKRILSTTADLFDFTKLAVEKILGISYFKFVI